MFKENLIEVQDMKAQIPSLPLQFSAAILFLLNRRKSSYHIPKRIAIKKSKKLRFFKNLLDLN